MSYRRSGSREARMRKARTAPWSAVLAVAGDDDDRLDDRAAANRQPAPDDVDIDAELRTQQRQQDEQADQDEQAIRLDPRYRDRGGPRQKAHKNAPAAQRRQRKQIEPRQHHVQQQGVAKIPREPLRGGVGQEGYDVEREA